LQKYPSLANKNDKKGSINIEMCNKGIFLKRDIKWPLSHNRAISLKIELVFIAFPEGVVIANVKKCRNKSNIFAGIFFYLCSPY